MLTTRSALLLAPFRKCRGGLSGRKAAAAAVRSFSASAADASSSPSSSSSTGTPLTTSINASCLGLEASLVTPYAESIGQLPEVASILDNPWTAKGHDAVESLRRASDIFASFQKGGREHTAVLALLAEVQQGQGDYVAAAATVQEICNHVTDKEIKMDATLALAKTFWMQGQFDDSLRVLRDDESVVSLLDESSSSSSSSSLSDEFPLHAAAVANTKALLALMIEGPFSGKAAAEAAAESFAAASASSVPLLARVALQLNHGAIEALHADTMECVGDSCLTRFNTAKEIWKEGLIVLQTDDATTKLNNGVAHALQGRLHSNMAWSSLQTESRHEKHIAEASESARLALKSFEHESLHGQEGLCRALSLVAQCYHRAQYAVTAEGLLQSALDYQPVSPQQYLERAAAYHAYAHLCKDWEKRQGDADKLLSKKRAILDALPGAWKNKTELHSCLWFWTPGLFGKV